MADKINDGGPVYPCRITPSVRDVHALREAGNLHLLQARELAANRTGMSLRDAAALAALPAIITATSAGQHDPATKHGCRVEEAMARDAWLIADAFIAAREAESNE
jgi:hypothetical protein